jgi:hypothetical protein
MPGMGALHWVSAHWFDLVQSLGIIASLTFTGVTFRTDARSRRVTNLIELTKQHREIWTELNRRPELSRVLDTSADLERKPVMPEEERFVRTLILHLNSTYQAMKNGVYMKPDGLGTDIRRFFSRPVAEAVWEKMKGLQDKDFVQFVEESLKDD